jgi:hypothetical protein
MLLVHVAHAAPTSRLSYSRDAAASTCPDEAALRKAVATRIGYDPFFPWATRTVVASIETRGPEHVATLYVVDEAGIAHGSRSISQVGPCADLLDALALSIAIAIDPDAAMPMPTTSAPAPAPPPAPAAPPPVPAPTSDAAASAPPVPPPPASEDSPERARRVGVPRLAVMAGVVGSGGIAPSASAGLTVGIVARWPAVSVSLEGRADAPATGGQGAQTVRVWDVVGLLVPCGHLGPLFACGIVEGGPLMIDTSAPGGHSVSSTWWAAGGRIGGSVPLGGSTELRVRGDVVGDAEPASYVVGGQTVWTSWPVAVSLAADAVVRFW